MPRIVTPTHGGPRTLFARDALDKLTSLRMLPALPLSSLQLPIQFGSIVPAARTPWSDLYPSGYIIHCLIQKPGYIFRAQGQSLRCGNTSCSFPCIETISTGKVCQIDLHHADLVVTDEVDAESMAKFHRRIEVHATTPAFHPNVGEPRQQYCLGYPTVAHNLYWFLDQLLAMVGWHAVNTSSVHCRNPAALAYYHKLIQERGAAAIGTFAPLYRGLL